MNDDGGGCIHLYSLWPCIVLSLYHTNIYLEADILSSSQKSNNKIDIPPGNLNDDSYHTTSSLLKPNEVPIPDDYCSSKYCTNFPNYSIGMQYVQQLYMFNLPKYVSLNGSYLESSPCSEVHNRCLGI